jgi:hypothetical protein
MCVCACVRACVRVCVCICYIFITNVNSICTTFTLLKFKCAVKLNNVYGKNVLFNCRQFRNIIVKDEIERINLHKFVKYNLFL